MRPVMVAGGVALVSYLPAAPLNPIPSLRRATYWTAGELRQPRGGVLADPGNPHWRF